MLRGMLVNHLFHFHIFVVVFFLFPSYLSFNFPDFCLFCFALVNGESETMHCIMVLSCCHKNNQSSTYEFVLIQIGCIKVQPCQVWILSGLRVLIVSWLTKKVSLSLTQVTLSSKHMIDQKELQKQNLQRNIRNSFFN